MLELVIDQRRRDIGGFEVGRVLPFTARRMVGPFIFFDHLGPIDFPRGLPRSVDVRPHPHIGLATITYLFAGEIMHRDSVGSEQSIRPAEVNWMIAGSGITHSERFERARAHGGSVHGIQSWIALTREQEECEPQFQHHGRESLPSFEQGGARARLIAGEAYGLRAPVKTFSPLFYLHWELPPDSSASVPRGATERAVYVVAGRIDLGGRRFGAGQLLVLSPGADVRVTAIGPAVVMTLGGEPVGPRFIEWNFVSSSQERIAQAKADWRAGRMLLPLHDDTEFIPLPPDPPPSGQPL